MCDANLKALIKGKHIFSVSNQIVCSKLDLYVEKIKLLKFNFKDQDMSNMVGFFDMRLDALMLFLQLDGLGVKEEDLWAAVVKWCKNRESIANKQPSAKKRKLNDGSSNKQASLLKTLCPFIRF